MPEITETFTARDRAAWRKWLKAHHSNRSEIWLVLFKKHVGTPCVSYDEAVEEALCFGWIDGILRRIDDEKHAQRFTPRKPSSKWSPSNRERVGKMIEQGRMTDAGLALVEEAKRNGQWEALDWRDSELSMPDELALALHRDQLALANFNAFTLAQRRLYLAWVLSAKRADTRAKRIQTVVSRAKQNKKPGIDM